MSTPLTNVFNEQVATDIKRRNLARSSLILRLRPLYRVFSSCLLMGWESLRLFAI